MYSVASIHVESQTDAQMHRCPNFPRPRSDRGGGPTPVQIRPCSMRDGPLFRPFGPGTRDSDVVSMTRTGYHLAEMPRSKKLRGEQTDGRRDTEWRFGKSRHLEFPPPGDAANSSTWSGWAVVRVSRSGRITKSERLILASSGKTKNANTK
jgi:hypothetical protein